MYHKSVVLLLLSGLLLVATGVFAEPAPSAAAGSREPPASPSPLLPEPKALEPFRLTDHNEQVFDRERLTGKWSLIYFGYTFCPDICPTALAILQEVFRDLEQRPRLKADLQGILISVDPKRDSPELLKKYVTYFAPAFLGVTGDVRQLKALAGQMGARYSIVYSWESTGEMDYLVDHSAALYLVDQQARLYAAFKPPFGPKEVSEKLLDILKNHNPGSG